MKQDVHNISGEPQLPVRGRALAYIKHLSSESTCAEQTDILHSSSRMENPRQWNGLSAKMETNSDQNGVIQPLLTGTILFTVLSELNCSDAKCRRIVIEM